MEGVDLVSLDRWMEARSLGSGSISGVRLLAGGTQNILLRFHRGPSKFVLRRPPPVLRAGSDETMRREMRVLEALRGSDVPHPGFIAGSSDETILGAAFYLMQPVDGFNPMSGLPALHAREPLLRRRMGLAVVEAIAALGALDYRAVGLADFGKPENFLERQVGRWRRQLESYADLAEWPGPGAIPGVGAVAAWLDRHRPSSFQPGIIHGDAHLANVMIRPDSGELAALVDWELSTIGDPLLDLGWLIATWPTEGSSFASDATATQLTDLASPADLAAHYAASSGRDLAALDWYIVLACYKLGIILEGSFARACAGKAPRETGERLHAHTLALFERALSIIR